MHSTVSNQFEMAKIFAYQDVLSYSYTIDGSGFFFELKMKYTLNFEFTNIYQCSRPTRYNTLRLQCCHDNMIIQLS